MNEMYIVKFIPKEYIKEYGELEEYIYDDKESALEHMNFFIDDDSDMYDEVYVEHYAFDVEQKEWISDVIDRIIF